MLSERMAEQAYLANHQLHEIYSKDPIRFIKACKTFDPRRKFYDEVDLDFDLYPFQEDYVRLLIDHIDKGKDLFTEKSRDMGISWVTLAVILWYWIYRPGFQALLGSRKEDYVDNWKMDSLFGKLDYLVHHLPVVVEGFDPKKDRNYLKLSNPSNNSAIIGESANSNFSRSGRYNIILFDELAFWPFQQSSWEGAGESTPSRIAVTTPSEVPSYAKSLRKSGLVKLHTVHWKLHPLKDEAWYTEQRLRKTADELAREVDINWEGSTAGIVYPEVTNVVVGNYPFLPNVPLAIAWDFGLDGMAIQWWQQNPVNGKWRLIDCFSFENKIIDYCFPAFGKPIDSKFSYRLDEIEFFNAVSQLPKAVHYGDPDVQKRDLKTGISTRQHLINCLDIYVNSNPKANSFPVRRSETKRFFQGGVEVNETPRTQYYLECIRNARYPQRLEHSQATTEIVLPIHDFTSHHRTATEYLAVNVSEVTKPEGSVDDYTGVNIPKPRPNYDPRSYNLNDDIGSVMPDNVSPWA